MALSHNPSFNARNPRERLAVQRVRKDELDNLLASGLTYGTIGENDLETLTTAWDIAKALGRKSLDFLPKAGPGQLRKTAHALAIPYRGLNGDRIDFVRLRLRSPRQDEKGKDVKYESPVGTPSRAYFPAGSLPKLNDGESPVYITEGEKKAMALSQLGKAAIGLVGFYGWKVGSRERLIPDLAGFDWKARSVFVVFDAEANPDTRRAAEEAGNRLARLLRESGAPAVYRIELPLAPGHDKVGVDDFLVARGQEGAEAFQDLVRSAKEIGGIKGIRIINPALPGEALYHGPIGEFIRAVDPYTEAHPMGVLAHLLPAIGTLLGPQVCVESGPRNPARINTVLVGPTNSGRKGTSFGPVDALMKRACPAFWDKQCQNGLSSGEGLIAFVGEEEGEYDPDTKTTSVVQREKRLYVVESEFSRVFANKSRDGNILSQVIREAFDSGKLSTLTVEPRIAVGTHVSITGHITPEELNQCLTSVDRVNGFGNRFLWFVVKSDKVLPNPPRIPNETFDALAQRLKALFQVVRFDGCVAAHSGAGLRFSLDDEAEALWTREYFGRLRWDQPGLGLAGTLVSRGSTMVLRTALIYAAVDAPLKKTLGRDTFVRPRLITASHLRAALAVWDYCEESAFQLFGSKSDSPVGEKVLKLLEVHGEMTTTDLNGHLSPGQKKAAKLALENLEKQGLIRSTKVKTGKAGAPSTQWSLARD